MIAVGLLIALLTLVVVAWAAARQAVHDAHNHMPHPPTDRSTDT